MAKSEIDNWFDAQTGAPATIATLLRKRINKLGPDLSVKLAWGFPTWSGQERILSIIAHKDRCNLQLWYGAELASEFPDRIEGTGKALRHVKVRSPDEIDAGLDAIILASMRQDAVNPRPVR